MWCCGSVWWCGCTPTLPFSGASSSFVGGFPFGDLSNLSSSQGREDEAHTRPGFTPGTQHPPPGQSRAGGALPPHNFTGPRALPHARSKDVIEQNFDRAQHFFRAAMVHLWRQWFRVLQVRLFPTPSCRVCHALRRVCLVFLAPWLRGNCGCAHGWLGGWLTGDLVGVSRAQLATTVVASGTGISVAHAQERPAWVDDDHAEMCQICRRDFTWMRRRHHVRDAVLLVLAAGCCCQSPRVGCIFLIPDRPLLCFLVGRALCWRACGCHLRSVVVVAACTVPVALPRCSI